MNRRMSVVLSMSALVLSLITQPPTTMVFARHHGGSSNSGGTDYAEGLDVGTSAAQSDNPDFDNTKSVSDCMNQGTTYTVAYCQGFVKGYYDTENSLRSSGGGRLTNPQQSQQSGQNWIDTCNKISFALVSPCSDLVNRDNTLTPQGVHVRNCIENGALLAGGALLLGTPPTAIVSALPVVAKLGGCENVIDFSKLSLGQLSGLGKLIR
jgi:hypothetical protein